MYEKCMICKQKVHINLVVKSRNTSRAVLIRPNLEEKPFAQVFKAVFLGIWVYTDTKVGHYNQRQKSENAL